MYRLIEKLLIIYLLTFLILLLLPVLKSFAGPPVPTPTPTTRSFSQVGGIANSTTSTDWCCAFYANVCAPCGNPALGYSYQMPNACDSAIRYENLWVRCNDSNCSGLTTGSYEVSLCHFDALDPSSGGGESCGDPCTIDSTHNNCNADNGIGPVKEGRMVYIRIHPSYSPDAPLKALWSALVEDCNDNGGNPTECPASLNECCSSHDEVGCNDCDCQSSVCDFDPYCCNVEWDSTCAEEANGFSGDDDDVEFPGCDVCSM